MPARPRNTPPATSPPQSIFRTINCGSDGAIGGAILFVVLLFAGAGAVADPNPAERRLLGFATAGRNIGAALVTAGASAAEPKAATMLIVTGVVGLVLLLAATTWLRNRDRPG